MKKIVLLSLISFFAMYMSAQTENKTINSKNGGKFFKSYEDYKAGKPVEGIDIISMGIYGWKLKINENGKESKVKQTELPYAWFYNAKKDDGHQTEHLMRVFDGKIYYVMNDGPASYYVGANDATWRSGSDQTFFLNSDTKTYDYYSETINGDIKVLTNKVLDELLTKYGLKDQFDADVIDVKKGSFAYFGKFAEKKLKYFNLMNEKAK